MAKKHRHRGALRKRGEWTGDVRLKFSLRYLSRVKNKGRTNCRNIGYGERGDYKEVLWEKGGEVVVDGKYLNVRLGKGEEKRLEEEVRGVSRRSVRG